MSNKPKIDIELTNGQTHPIGNWTSAEWFYVGFKCALECGFPQPIEEDENDFFIHQENNRDAFFHGMAVGEEYKLPDGFVRYDEHGNEITTKEHLRDHGWCMKTPMEKDDE